MPILPCRKPGRVSGGRLLKLPPASRIFFPGNMNDQPVFAELFVGWHAEGLGLTLKVSGKRQPVAGTSKNLSYSDSLLLWLDTRPTGSVHRATEYCHHFACLPVDKHADGATTVVTQPIAQQRAQRIESDTRKFLTAVELKKDGYILDVWIPGSQIYGFGEVAELGRLGFYCVVQDTELGDQTLSVHDDFPISYDPSTWVQLDLQSDAS